VFPGSADTQRVSFPYSTITTPASLP
jgi:hypothetical protein